MNLEIVQKRLPPKQDKYSRRHIRKLPKRAALPEKRGVVQFKNYGGENVFERRPQPFSPQANAVTLIVWR
jgi:hypothetical protein